MKILNLLVLSILFASCATERFKPESNCTAESLKRTGGKTTLSPEVSTDLAIKEMQSLSDQYKSCFQDYLDSGRVYTYQVCMVLITDKKGAIEFLEVEDNKDNLPTDLRKCIESKIRQKDFSKLKNSKILQPLNLYPKRQ